ncbi:ATP-grasp domain-containing protein [Micromonospora sp. CPCC 205561]|uniref:ATP-grasp domain-containing protein n=1 Tax=Micromonospora sp. CPCC 205561 TaxID=3122407 RepID=UPI002FF28D40
MTDHHQPTRGKPRVALVTCAWLPDLDPDDRLVLAPLARRGVTAEAVGWADPTADWSAYDLVVLRSPWDYALRHDEFVAWASTVPALANPADVVRWNTDKRYLGELSRAGVPTVPTDWVAPGQSWRRPAERGEYVIKPAVSAGSQDTGRYDLADPEHRELAAAHVRRLSDAGRLTMVQPYLDAIDTAGETALLFLAGPQGPTFSHAIRKSPMLTGPDLGVEGLFRPEEVAARTATPEQLEVARRALAAVPGGPGRLLYARVDLVPGPDGAPVLVELELTEPSLFLGYADGAADRLADAIASRLGHAVA